MKSYVVTRRLVISFGVSLLCMLYAHSQGSGIGQPIAIDSYLEGTVYVLSSRGNVSTLIRENDRVQRRDLVSRLPKDDFPVDLSVAASGNISVAGHNRLVLVLGNAVAVKPSCEVYAYSLDETNRLLHHWPIDGACGGIDVYPGGVSAYAYVVTSSDNKLYRINLSAEGSKPEFVGFLGAGLGKAGALAVDPTSGRGWYVADATGAGIIHLAETSQGMRSERLEGVDTNISSLRLIRVGARHQLQLYATDTARRRVFRLLGLNNVRRTVDIVSSRVTFVHPAGITSDGSGFVICDDGARTVTFFDKDWNRLAFITYN